MADAGAGIARRRRARDRLLTMSVRSAALMVFSAVFLIFAYLVMVCLPLASPAGIDSAVTQNLDPDVLHVVRESDGSLWRLDLPEDRRRDGPTAVASSAARAVVARDGELHFFDLVASPGQPVTAAASSGNWLGRVSLAESTEPAQRMSSLTFDSHSDTGLVSFFTEDGKLHAVQVLIEDGRTSRVEAFSTQAAPFTPGRLLVDARASRVLRVSGDRYMQWQLPSPGRGSTPLLAGGQLAGVTEQTTAFGWGPGRETLLIATVEGFLYRFDLARPGFLPLGPPRRDLGEVNWIASENLRRLSALRNTEGELILLVPTSGRTLVRQFVPDFPTGRAVGLSTDGSTLFDLHDAVYRRWPLLPGSPDTGWRSLWQAQRYGAYDAPAHVWHPDGTAIGVLPKYGLSPLLWGTFKAALYGMLVAVPLALGAAVYTGYFLPPRRRNQVKPAVEMLEAFPTVVLGFIAGLWLAPLLGDYLVFVLFAPVILLLTPVTLAALHVFLQRLSLVFVRRPPRIAVLSFAYLLGFLTLAFQASSIEAFLFGGRMQDWLLSALGLEYGQRNALIVGFAMGIAITPVMFSIVEDAINAVPRSLSDGSLALGATRWQALWRVVLPAASPALLSALLIGFARGLGETMIVLLATGNAPLMESDPFTGLRSLAANIAIELPEAGAGGVHFRLLFLGALVLFFLTFTLNTLAEVFRQRLRYAYAGR